jgi:hypothetical protein
MTVLWLYSPVDRRSYLPSWRRVVVILFIKRLGSNEVAVDIDFALWKPIIVA